MMGCFSDKWIILPGTPFWGVLFLHRPRQLREEAEDLSYCIYGNTEDMLMASQMNSCKHKFFYTFGDVCITRRVRLPPRRIFIP